MCAPATRRESRVSDMQVCKCAVSRQFFFVPFSHFVVECKTLSQRFAFPDGFSDFSTFAVVETIPVMLGRATFVERQRIDATARRAQLSNLDPSVLYSTVQYSILLDIGVVLAD